MTKLTYCLQKLQEFNEQDYSIGLAQDIAEAESEVLELVSMVTSYVEDYRLGGVENEFFNELLAEFGGAND